MTPLMDFFMDALFLTARGLWWAWDVMHGATPWTISQDEEVPK